MGMKAREGDPRVWFNGEKEENVEVFPFPRCFAVG